MRSKREARASRDGRDGSLGSRKLRIYPCLTHAIQSYTVKMAGSLATKFH